MGCAAVPSMLIINRSYRTMLYRSGQGLPRPQGWLQGGAEHPTGSNLRSVRQALRASADHRTPDHKAYKDSWSGFPENGWTRRSALQRAALVALSVTAGLAGLLPPGSALAKVSIVAVEKAQKPEEQDIYTAATGLKFADVRQGRGEALGSGGLAVAHIMGFLADGRTFLDTRASGSPLLLQMGVTSDCKQAQGPSSALFSFVQRSAALPLSSLPRCAAEQPPPPCAPIRKPWVVAHAAFHN